MSEYYVAVLARNSEGEVFATVPDLPGANSAAATAGEALKLVSEFANDYVRDLVEDGHDVPKARAIEDIPVDPEDHEIGRAMIPVELPGKSIKISISIDQALLERADRAAAAEGTTRSGYIAEAVAARLMSMVERREPKAGPDVVSGGDFAALQVMERFAGAFSAAAAAFEVKRPPRPRAAGAFTDVKSAAGRDAKAKG